MGRAIAGMLKLYFLKLGDILILFYVLIIYFNIYLTFNKINKKLQ